jgi:diaminopropionate ammonia-lyase
MISDLWIHPAAPERDVALIRELLPDGDVARAVGTLRTWPEHRATPLHRLDGAAQQAGVAEVLYKDESLRFGVGSFKAAGAAWAVSQAVEDAGAAGVARPTLACATDGNHGRAVAWAARRFGCEAVVYLPHHALPERERRIRALGARTVHIDGDYDVAVARVQEDAAREGWCLISDTSARPRDEGNLRVLAGYALMVEEVLAVLRGAEPPTHVFLQAGVGTLAAGVIAQLARRLGDAAPRCVLVEPATAACVLRSLAADAPADVDGPLDTAMDCLAAGRVSATAWPILRSWADGAIAIDDAAATNAVHALGEGRHGSIVATAPSGAAGLAGLLEAAANENARGGLDLGPRSRILVIGTEEALPRS